jgi:hypothetical protein
MNWYGQTTEPWASQLLGFNTDPNFTISRYGCLVTAASNLLKATTGRQVDPGAMNDWLKANDGFVAGEGILIWSVLPKLGGFTAGGTAPNLAALKTFLAPVQNFAIMGVNNDSHFVLVTEVNQIVDSEDGETETINYYPFSSAHLYTAVNMPAQAAPAPIATPKSGTVIVTASPALNLRTGPAMTFPLGTGQDNSGKTIHSLPNGASVGYVDVKPGQPINGNTNWLVSDRGNYFSASGTNYQA